MKRGSIAVAMLVLFLFAFAFSASVMILEAEAAVCDKCSKCYNFWDERFENDGALDAQQNCVPHTCYQPLCNQP